MKIKFGTISGQEISPGSRISLPDWLKTIRNLQNLQNREKQLKISILMNFLISQKTSIFLDILNAGKVLEEQQSLLVLLLV